MRFDEFDSAYEFYCDNAKMAGFDVRKSKKSAQVAWYVCNKDGFCDSGKVDKSTQFNSEVEQKEFGRRLACRAEQVIHGWFMVAARDLRTAAMMVVTCSRMETIGSGHLGQAGWGCS
jgi:hypothetical protein